jgi:hypothetical protein
VKKRLLILIGILCASGWGYSQSICNCYITNADSIYQVVPMTQGTDIGYPPTYHCDNCSSPPIKLPFNFCFYGKNYDTVYINNKGNLSFEHPIFTFSSNPFPLGMDTLMLAPFYSDVDDTPQNVASTSFAFISYNLTATHLFVQWSIVGYNTFDDDLYNNFQLIITNGADPILPAGNNVSYCYYVMQWASGDSSGGSMGFGGTPATVGINKGDHVHFAQFGAFDYPGHTFDGPFDTNSQAYWLNGKSFIFNTCVSGNNIPPVIVDSYLCDTVTLCATDTNTFTLSFLCPQPGQTATVSAYSPGLSGLSSTTSSSHSVYSITTQLIAHLRDTGTHVITVKAIDNGALTDSMQFTVFIKPCGDTVPDLGIDKINQNNTFSLYPNPNKGIFTIQSSIENDALSVDIYNMLGEKVLTEILPSSQEDNTINLTEQPGGIYLYRIISGKGELVGNGKFVIQ